MSHRPRPGSRGHQRAYLSPETLPSPVPGEGRRDRREEGKKAGRAAKQPLFLLRAWARTSGVPHPAGTGPVLTMELRLRGDPEDCVKRPATVGRARRLGDTPVLRLGVPADARFRLLRFRLSCPWL